jgi:hypothetical protein
MLDRKADSPFPTLVDRFVTYAKIHTTSNDESDTYPSTERQFDLARLLVDELKAVGLADASVDDNCYVTATLPASPGLENVPVIAFLSHMDTYPPPSMRTIRAATSTCPRKGGKLSRPRIRIWPNASARPSSPPTGPPCWAPTTRPASPRSWKR